MALPESTYPSLALRARKISRRGEVVFGEDSPKSTELSRQIQITGGVRYSGGGDEKEWSDWAVSQDYIYEAGDLWQFE